MQTTVPALQYDACGHCELMKETELFLGEFSATVTNGFLSNGVSAITVQRRWLIMQIKSPFFQQRLPGGKSRGAAVVAKCFDMRCSIRVRFD